MDMLSCYIKKLVEPQFNRTAMKKILSVAGLLLFVFAFFQFNRDIFKDSKQKHIEFLENSPFKHTLKLSKKERKGQGLPPNKYFEREWELTMNPSTGKPEPEKVLQLQQKLSKRGPLQKVPGDAMDNKWVERGPNNVGGRTRVLLFDPNDTTHKKVYAGAVSGGLWVNLDITNANASWTQVTGVPSNMNVSCITVDPRDSSTWYLGTGEQYTFGAAVGNGVYKTTDGGSSWQQINIVAEGPGDLSGTFSKLLEGIYYINDIVAWDNGTNTEIFVGVGSHFYGDSNDPNNNLGPQSAGLYRSINGGNSWSRISDASMAYTISSFTFYYIPNDIEIGADNKLWLGCIATPDFGFSGAGAVFSSVDGENWSLMTTLANSNRVELAVSNSNANKLYALTQGTTSSGPHIYGTTDGFSSVSELSKPNDADPDIPENDFTRGQDFYDLMIEVDPNDDDILYVGGINLFRSIDGASSWSQISKWHSGISGGFPVVHADQHAMTFRPGASNEAVFGNDGGVYYCSSLSTANTTSSTTNSVNSDYNVTQFYYTAMGPNSSEEFFLGGTQDNGTPFFSDPTSQNSIDISGGDGAACFVDQVGASYLIVSYVYNNSYGLYNFILNEWRTINSDSENDGDFINQAALDSNLDILYTNGSSGSTSKLYRYSNLLNISSTGSALKRSLTDDLLVSSPTAITVSNYTTTSSTLLVGTQTGELLKVTNANTDPIWTDISDSNFLGSISDVEFGNSENEIFVSFHNYGVSSIWYSKDGGATWSEKEGDLPDIPVKAILSNPIESGEVIIGTELGVWKTTNWNDASPTREQSYNGMSDVKVTDFEYRADGYAVMAATHGRGLFSGVFTATTPTFALSTTESSTKILETKAVSFQVDYEVFAGFDEAVAVSVSGNPTGSVVTFSPESPITMNSNGSFEFTVTPNEEYETKTYSLEVSVTSSSETKTIGVLLEVDLDIDNDGLDAKDDNCIEVANPDQLDSDNDGMGDVCDDDDDNDGILDFNDNSPLVSNPDQLDTDNDGEGDASDTDDDNDDILDDDDNCPLVFNPDQLDVDEDNIGDICDDNIKIDPIQPKGFTPNNDGINDEWVIEKLEEMYPNNELEIYNRSGQLVYKAKPYKNDFTGDSNIPGNMQKLPVGSYMYILKSGEPVADFYPEAYVKKGWIYLKY